MQPKVMRQNAFSTYQDPFKKFGCCICLLNEEWGHWKKVTCQCNITDDYCLVHEFCLNKTKRCRKCQTSYIEKRPSGIIANVYTYCKDNMTTYKKAMVISTIIAICLLISIDLYTCITIEIFDHNELPELPEDEDILLPVLNFICLKSRPTSKFIFQVLFRNYTNGKSND